MAILKKTVLKQNYLQLLNNKTMVDIYLGKYDFIKAIALDISP
jgi:hypothetical protein